MKALAAFEAASRPAETGSGLRLARPGASQPRTEHIADQSRPDRLDAVDEIVMLDHGQIVQRGTHKELVRKHGLYPPPVEPPTLRPDEMKEISP